MQSTHHTRNLCSMSSINTLKNLNSLLLFFLLLSCKEAPENNVNTETNTVASESTKANPEKESTFLMDTGEKTYDSVYIVNKAVLVVQLDTHEINQLLEFYGEDNFYTAIDDLMWYNAKLDSISIPVFHTDADIVQVNTRDSSFTITKDTSFDIFTHYLFDEGKLNRVDLFDLL